MRKARTIGRTRDVRDHSGGHRLVETVEKLVVGNAGRTSERLQSELTPDHRRENENLVAVDGQVTKAASDDVAHALGDRQPRSALVEPSLRCQQPHDLTDEERIAFGFLLDRGHHFVTRRLAGNDLDEAGNIALAEPAKRELLVTGSRTNSVITAVNGWLGLGSTSL